MILRVLLVIALCVPAVAIDIQVSRDGEVATIAEARDFIRSWRTDRNLPRGLPEEGFTVVVESGTYVLDEAIAFDARDSGDREVPIVYRAAEGADVRLLGGKVIPGWSAVDDDALARLDESARGNIVQADLEALGITDYGSPKGGGLELFFGGEAMRLSRWPNEGFTHIRDIVVDDGHVIHGRKGSKVPQIYFDSDRAARWVEEPDLWATGYWFWDWSEQRMPVDSVDLDESILTLGGPAHHYGYRKGQWFYIFNALSELDEPGEFYVDRDEGVLYFWPPGPVESTEAYVSVIGNTITMENTEHVRFQGFRIEGTRSTAVRITGGKDNWIVGCTIQNVGANAISVNGGEGHGVVGCDITQTGSGGISLVGGDRTMLTPAGHFAENNHIHHYARLQRTYASGIQMSGVGLRATRNLIHNAPHMAIGFGGNDHIIEGNEIHSVCYESNDAGAIYAGRNWTMRGHKIRDNYLHDINGFKNEGCAGVYLDDMFASAEITGNLFVNVYRAILLGGGRDCLMENNVFVECRKALHIDARALGWAEYHADDWLAEIEEKGTILGIKYDEPPYATRYPELPKILEGEPKAPEGNVVRRNIFIGEGWDQIEGKARPYLTMENNAADVEVAFVDAANGDYQFADPEAVPVEGFVPLAFGRMGLYESRYRASWPVEHEVREQEH